MNENLSSPKIVTGTDLARRAFLGTSVLSLGSIAFSSLMASRSLASAGGESPLALGDATAAVQLGTATATRVIMIFAAGGLSQHDLFDEKPLLNKRRGEELPDSVRKGQRITGVTEKQGAKLGGSVRVSSSSRTARAASRYPNCSGRWVRSPTTSAWCAPCRRTMCCMRQQCQSCSPDRWQLDAFVGIPDLCPRGTENKDPGVRGDAFGNARRRFTAPPAHVAQRLPAGAPPGLSIS